MLEADQNDKSSLAGVKGEFVGKPVPPDGNRLTSRRKLDRMDPTESDENWKQGLICKYVPMRLLRLWYP